MRAEPVDDLSEDTGARCARCGTGWELTRPNALLLGGRWYGEIVCERCEGRQDQHPRLSFQCPEPPEA